MFYTGRIHMLCKHNNQGQVPKHVHALLTRGARQNCTDVIAHFVHKFEILLKCDLNKYTKRGLNYTYIVLQIFLNINPRQIV